ncbi:HTH_Tnp_Tc3_2 domain-containing protein [Trichonephila clavipes]|nr:HTH_Tnp_Tc3_2 domain-containing protein [Trichonephila clavipes]
MVLKANDRRNSCPCHDEFSGPRSDYVRQGGRRGTLPKSAADFNARPSTRATVRTIQRNILNMGFRSRRPNHVPLLTARHKALRLACARQHWTVDDWKHVAWSYESGLQLIKSDGSVKVWRQLHESKDLIGLQGTVQAGGGSVMIKRVCS